MRGLAAVRSAQRFLVDATRCTVCGGSTVELATAWKGRGTGNGESLHVGTRFGSAGCTCPPKSQPAPKFCRCGHSEDSHYQGGECQHIDGDERCGCTVFVDENDRTTARAIDAARVVGRIYHSVLAAGMSKSQAKRRAMSEAHRQGSKFRLEVVR